MSWLSAVWYWYSTHRDVINPIVAFTGAAAAFATAAIGAFAALRNAGSATRQAEIASRRRITESFSKAIEQLGNDKLEVRLGGIYALESISKDSPDDYWTVMETLTAFFREQTRRAEAEESFEKRVERDAYFLWEKAGQQEGRSEEFWKKAVAMQKPATDVAAVLTVIRRRTEENRARELWPLDFSGAFLRGANLAHADLLRANLAGAHLERATLSMACLASADLSEAHLEGANLWLARLTAALLMGAHLEGAILEGTQLEGALLMGAHFEGANLYKAVSVKVVAA